MAFSTATSPRVAPPDTALPSLPALKVRNSSSASVKSRLPSTSPTPSRLAVRTASKATTSPIAVHAKSTPSVPTLKSIATLPSPQDKTADAELRRSISINSFPQPPSIHKQGNTTAKPNSSIAFATENGLGQPNSATGSISGGGRTRLKRLRITEDPPSTEASLHSNPSSLPNRAGEKLRPGANMLEDLNNSAAANSPMISRSSSPHDSCSTSATTFEDVDDARRGREDAGQASSNGTRLTQNREVKGNVIVSVRVRPDAGGNGDKKSEGEWMVDGRRSLVAYRGREGGDYYYDNVFAAHDKNHKVYDAAAKRLVRRVMEGYHGTVFAYGMTGTGKTYSMQGTATSPGVIPLAITDIFSYIRETPHREFLLRVSYLEIYNEKIHDLLSPATASGVGSNAPQPEEIKLREDSKRGVYASPLKEEIVQSPTQLLRVIARGDHSRRTRSTQYNAQSSRSHAVVQIVVESRERAPITGTQGDKRAPLMPGGVRVSTLSMIDLAGSERAAENKERRTEGAHINKSLLTLGTVIARLSGDRDGSGNPTDKDGKHLPYRDSKLTRLLQPALSGNSLVSILCTIQIGSAGSVATATGHTGETLNTLKFAARAKNNIVSHAKRAEEAFGSGTDAGSKVLLERYRMEILNLRTQLENQSKSNAEREEKHLEKQAQQRHEEQMLEMQLARTALKERIEHLNRLILSSKSTGVNSKGQFSTWGGRPILNTSDAVSYSSRNPRSPVKSLRSTASQSSLGAVQTPLQRTPSSGSTVALGEPITHSPNSSFGNDGEEEDSTGEFGDGIASFNARIRALQADLADKNRYISTLEKRLLQARRSSQSRMSLAFGSSTQRSPNTSEEDPVAIHLLEEKDAEITLLRSQLDDKDRMVNALRSAARKRDNADFGSEPTSPEHRREGQHQSKDSNESQGSNGAFPFSPVELLSPQKDQEAKRKSIDEMSKILDEMIQDRVENGQLTKSSKGSVRLATERKLDGGGKVPHMGVLAASLRPTSSVSIIEASAP